MQISLPFYPEDVKMISTTLGVLEKENEVYYFLGGQPCFQHKKNDIKAFYYFICTQIELKVIKSIQVVEGLGINKSYLSQQLKTFREKGREAFFQTQIKVTKCQKFDPEMIEKVQKKLDGGQSNHSIALQESLTEGAIRYHIKHGRLKKNTYLSNRSHPL